VASRSARANASNASNGTTALDAPAPIESRGDQAYRGLKTRLLMGEFPINVRLGEERLAAMIGVSRTPIREALKRLAAEGLVGTHPEGGYQPLVPDVTVMRHLYEVRAGLELQALQRPGRMGTRHDPAIMEPLRDQWRALADGPLPAPDPGFVLLDESFHITLASAADNDVAVDFPGLTIVLAHPSFPWQDEAISVALHKQQVYIDLSGWSPKYFPPQLVRYANTQLRDRVLFGSDFPLITPDRWLADFAQADFKDEVRPLILKENAVRLLGLR